MNKKITNYQSGTLLEIVETTFHDYPLGTIVKVVMSDWSSYHVVNVNRDGSQITDAAQRWWWVRENQVSPLKQEERDNNIKLQDQQTNKT